MNLPLEPWVTALAPGVSSNWAPFELAPAGEKRQEMRPLLSAEGISDRLRSAAFAEIQARDAFEWASRRFTGEAQPDCCEAWKRLARAEDRHLNWLLKRISELGFTPADRRVDLQLWRSFQLCQTAAEFARFMASAEERGRVAGERFAQALKDFDPTSADIFGQIAHEEQSHIDLARRFFPISVD